MNMRSDSQNLSAESFYKYFRNNKASQRETKFIVRALKESGYKISGRRKRYVRKNRGKDAFRPKDLPRLLGNMDNTSCKMASLVSAVTGSRREETIEILKDNINFNSCTIRLEVTKKGTPQDVYFPRSFAPIVQKWIHYSRDTKYLFPQRSDPNKPISVTTLSKELEKAVKRSGLFEIIYVKENGYKAARYGFHSFRKFFCSNLVNSGVSMEVARKLMRHEKMELTAQVYAQLGKKSLTEAMDKIDPYSVEKAKEYAGVDEEKFTDQYLKLFNDYREGKLNSEEFRQQRNTLKDLQGFIKS